MYRWEFESRFEINRQVFLCHRPYAGLLPTSCSPLFMFGLSDWFGVPFASKDFGAVALAIIAMATDGLNVSRQRIRNDLNIDDQVELLIVWLMNSIVSQAKWWKHCGDNVRLFSNVSLFQLDRLLVAKPQVIITSMTVDCSEKSDFSNMLYKLMLIRLTKDKLRNLNSRVDVSWFFGQWEKTQSRSVQVNPSSFRFAYRGTQDFWWQEEAPSAAKQILNHVFCSVLEHPGSLIIGEDSRGFRYHWWRLEVFGSLVVGYIIIFIFEWKWVCIHC